jgi:cytochrome c oxidase cbb3-type subunit 3
MPRLIVWLYLLLMCLPAYAAPDGAKLYAQNCASCHGEKGDGGIGIPLSLPSFQALVDDDFLKQSILHGREGRVMPAFSYLREAEVDAVVKYMRGWYKGKVPLYSSAAVKGNAEHGKPLFEKHCASCHGVSGEGGHGTGVTFSRPRNFPIMPPSLQNPGYLASAKDAMIRATLVTGRDGTPMLSAGKLGLKDTEVNDIVAYVRSFESVHPPTSMKQLETDDATIVMASPYDLKTTIENVKKALNAGNFVYIREQPLNAGLVAEGSEDPKQYIIYFCNFGLLNQALATDPRVGLFLPCRITVVEKDGKVSIMAVNPKRLSHIYNNSELIELCDRLTKMYIDTMEEAVL